MPILSRSLSILESFSNSPLSVFGQLPTSLPYYHTNHLTWVDLSLIGPLRFSLVLSVFGLLPGHHKKHLIWVDLSLMAPLELLLATAHTVRPPHLISRTIWSEWTQFRLSPLACMWKFPLRFICRMVSNYIYCTLSECSGRLLIAYSVSFVIFWLLSLLYFWFWKCIPGILTPKLVTSSTTLSQ